MTPFPNGTGPAPHAPHAAAGTAGTSAIGGAHGRPCLSGAAFRRFSLPALLGLLLLAAPLHAAYGTESGTPPSGDMEWKGEASTPSRRCPILPFDGELTLGAGGNVSSSPYKGYGPDWLPFPMITYEGERFFIRGYTAGVKIINLPYLELSAFAGYDSTSFEASESSNRRLRRLEDRSSSAQAGMELRLISPYGMFHVSGAGDVLSHSNGFNGDIGFIVSIDPQEHVMSVQFDDERVAEYEGADVDDLELAYCISVHKSQGSEFPVVVMPAVGGPPMLLTRNLFYTAVTRARRMVMIVGRESAIDQMIANVNTRRRYSALCWRLQQVMSL